MALDHETLTEPTEALWYWLHTQDHAFPDRFLDGSGHLTDQAAQWMTDWCERILAGGGGPVGEDHQAVRSLAVALAEGYDLGELTESAAVAPSAPTTWDIGTVDAGPISSDLTAADRAYWVSLMAALEAYRGLRDDIDTLPGLLGRPALAWLGLWAEAKQAALGPRAEASPLGPFSGVAMPTTALWPWLYDWSDPDAHLDGSGHLRPGTAMDMIRACRRLRSGEQSRRNLIGDHWPDLPVLVQAFVEGYEIDDLRRAYHLIDPLVYDEEAEDVPDVLTDTEAGFFADLERALCDYLNARPATLGIPEAFAGPGVRLFEPEDLHELVEPTTALADRLAVSGVAEPGRYLEADGHLSLDTVEAVIARAAEVVAGTIGPAAAFESFEDLAALVVAFLDGYDVAGRSAVEMLCGHSGDWPNVTNLGYGAEEAPHGWRGEWWMLRDCLYAYWAARSVALDGARTVAPAAAATPAAAPA